MRAAVLSLILAAAPVLAGAAEAPPPAAASAPAPKVSPLVAASRAAKASSAAAAPRKVWTLDDLEALRKERPGPVNVTNLPSPSTIAVVNGPAAAPSGVTDRYRELADQASEEIAKLEREKLSRDNPLLRGMGPAKARTDAEIAADLVRWRERRNLALKSAGEPKSE